MANETEKKEQGTNKIINKIAKRQLKKLLIITLIIILCVLLISGATYIVMKWIAEKISKEALKYTQSVSISESGGISTEVSAEELWKNMKEQGLEIDKYLDGPSDLAKLLNAELVTQLPDMRPNVDKPIDWDSILDGTWTNSANWLGDEPEYISHMKEKMNHYGSNTDYGCMIDCDNCRLTIFHKENGQWKVIAGWNTFQGVNKSWTDYESCGVENSEKHNWSGPRSRSFRGAFEVVGRWPDSNNLGFNNYAVCYVECNHGAGAYGADDCQRFEFTGYGDPDTTDKSLCYKTTGCCGLSEEHATWIYNNIPDGTKVVVFDKYNPMPSGTEAEPSASGQISEDIKDSKTSDDLTEKEKSEISSSSEIVKSTATASSLQGIIRFKRHDRDGNEYYLTYANPSEFQGWVEAYNNGDKSAGEKAMTHFTLKKGASGSSSNSPITSGGGQAIADAAVQLACSVAVAPDQNLLRAQWPGTRIYNDKTAAYIDARESLISGKSSDGGDYASCDMGVATAVRYSKVDPNMEYNTTPNIWTYLRNSSEWEDVGEYTRPNSPTNLQPGDVLLSGQPYGHILIYTGNEAVRKKYPNSNADAYEAGYSSEENESYYPRLFEITKDGRNNITFTIFRHISANNTNDSSTDISEKILQATNNVGWPGPQQCLKWVDDVYEAAGISPDRKDTARHAGEAHIISTSSANIPVGAAVYAEGSGPAGHVGIYIGNGKVKDSINSGLRETDLQSWMNEQQWIGWGWEDGNQTRGSNASSSSSSNSNNSAPSNYTGQLDTSQAGDGWDGTYTSSAGITYRSYHQGQGPWAGDGYGSGTIASVGCGPTSTAIIASGLVSGQMYTPGDIAPITAESGTTSDADGRTALCYALSKLGLTNEIVEAPSTDEIVNQLRAGKVLIRSCPAGTVFCGVDHFVAVVDVNDQGQVYVLNIGEPGWYDPAELVSGAKYAIAIDAKAPANAPSSNTGSSSGPGYQAVVATFKEIDKTVGYGGPDIHEAADTMGVSLDDQDIYRISTTTVNYEELVQPYVLPFSFLCDLLITGQSKGFIMDLAKLAYKSDLEVSIYDNVTTVTDVDKWTYSKVTDAKISGNVECDGFTETVDHQHLFENGDPISEENGFVDRMVVTATDTISYALTRANTWIVDYKQGYEPNINKGNTQTGQTSKPNQKPGPWKTIEGTSHNCSAILNAINSVLRQANEKRKSDAEAAAAESETLSGGQNVNPEATYTPAGDADVTKNITEQQRSYFVNMNDSTEDTTDVSQYTAGTKSAVLKDNNSKELSPNFVTIFNSYKYRQNRNNILSATEWVFEIMEANASNTLEVFKYLLYKATGISYGVTELSPELFEPGKFQDANQGGSDSKLLAFVKAWEGADTDAAGHYIVANVGDGCRTIGFGVTVEYDAERFAAKGINVSGWQYGACCTEDYGVSNEIIDQICEQANNEFKDGVRGQVSGCNPPLNEQQIDTLTAISYQYGNIGNFISVYNQYGNTDALRDSLVINGYQPFIKGPESNGRAQANWKLFHEGIYTDQDGNVL